MINSKNCLVVNQFSQVKPLVLNMLEVLKF